MSDTTFVEHNGRPLVIGEEVHVAHKEHHETNRFTGIVSQIGSGCFGMVPEGLLEQVLIRFETWHVYVTAPPLPTVPGTYVDKQGDPWKLDESGEWWHGQDLYAPETLAQEILPEFGPLTRMIPASTLVDFYDTLERYSEHTSNSGGSQRSTRPGTPTRIISEAAWGRVRNYYGLNVDGYARK